MVIHRTFSSSLLWIRLLCDFRGRISEWIRFVNEQPIVTVTSTTPAVAARARGADNKKDNRQGRTNHHHLRLVLGHLFF